MRAQQQFQIASVPRLVDASPSHIAPYEQMDGYDGPPQYRSNVGLHFLLFVLAISLISVAAFLALGYFYPFESIPV
jgi:uncharacterized membrane protein YphA (DoxX/SURF4 family)